jgi:hypothetical protein
MSDVVLCKEVGTTKHCIECGGAHPHTKDSCEPCPIHGCTTCVEILPIGVGGRAGKEGES